MMESHGKRRITGYSLYEFYGHYQRSICEAIYKWSHCGGTGLALRERQAPGTTAWHQGYAETDGTYNAHALYSVQHITHICTDRLIHIEII